MENFKAIDFHQTRDFSRKMNATFEFVKQNFKGLTKSILVIAGPPILVASMLLGSMIGDFFSLTGSFTGANGAATFSDYFLSVNFWMQVGLIMIFITVSGVTTISTINNYIILYGERQTNQIEVHEVWQRVRNTFWMYLGTMIQLALLAIVLYVAMIIPIALVRAISPLLIFFAVMFLMGVVFYLLISASLVFIIRGYERVGFFRSVARSYKLVKGKWWSTFGLIMVLYLIVGTASYVFIMPWYVITLVNSLHNTNTSTFSEPGMSYQVMTIVFFTLYYLAQMILYSLPNVGIAFQYFNLVEMKEAKGLMNEINSIGQASTSSSGPEDEHY